MTPAPPRRPLPSLLALLAGCVCLLPANTRAQAPANVPALFLSDIHLDPYHDPSKVAKLDAAPLSEWRTILAAPDSATIEADSAALQKTCPVRGVDTPDILWQSSLRAIHADAARVRFVTISGDLLAHAFDCKYKTLVPAGTHATYVAFVEKTIRYIVSGLRTTLPGVPLYISLGNNDSGCTDYQLAAEHDDFLALTAKIVAESLPASLSATARTAVLRDFSLGGYYSVPIAELPNTRLLVLDDLFLSGKYATCGGSPDPAPAAAQLAWLTAQLAAARARRERVWVLGHIPPGVDLYSTARKQTNICAGSKPTMFLGSEKLAEVLAANPGIIRLALFGHTHSDEIRLLEPDTPDAKSAIGVPLKVVASITPVNGNRPTFTVASINPATSTLADYSVFMASNLTGVAATWSKEYTYSTAYHQPAFNSVSLTRLIAAFQADPAAKSPASQAYLRNYFPGDISQMIQVVWPQYACSMNHDSAIAFTVCACNAANVTQHMP